MIAHKSLKICERCRLGLFSLPNKTSKRAQGTPKTDGRKCPQTLDWNARIALEKAANNLRQMHPYEIAELLNSLWT